MTNPQVPFLPSGQGWSMNKNGRCMIFLDSERAVVKVRAPFNPNFNTLSRSIEGRKWVPGEKYWEFPVSSIAELMRVLHTCFEVIQRPPLELLEIWDELTKDDIESIYNLLSRRVMKPETLDKINKFFAGYITLAEAKQKMGRLIREASDDND